jgi:hypothetical protein
VILFRLPPRETTLPLHRSLSLSTVSRGEVKRRNCVLDESGVLLFVVFQNCVCAVCYRLQGGPRFNRVTACNVLNVRVYELFAVSWLAVVLSANEMK